MAIKAGSNTPYWSLPFEFWYYMLFAALTYARGLLRVALVLVAAVIAGPKILVLFPVWLMGVAAWRWRDHLGHSIALAMALGPIVLFAIIELAGGQALFVKADSPWWPWKFSAYDFILGVLIAAHIVGVARLQLAAPPRAVGRAVKRAAGCTFSLYLFHLPLLSLTAAVCPSAPVRQVLVWIVPLLGAAALATVTEAKKHVVKRWILALPLSKGARVPA